MSSFHKAKKETARLVVRRYLFPIKFVRDLLSLSRSLFSSSLLSGSLGSSLQRVGDASELSSQRVSVHTGGVTDQSVNSSRIDSCNFCNLFNLSLLSGSLLLTASCEKGSCYEHKCNLFHFFAF